MSTPPLKIILEALLVSQDEPLSIKQLISAFPDDIKPSSDAVKKALKDLENDYQVRAIELKKLASGYCLQTRSEFALWVNHLKIEKPTRYSRAFLETLSIIAYRQPVTRADIENIRGVGVSSSILKTLLERNWVRIQGYKDVPGKPALYVTTPYFLDYFNLISLASLPPLSQSLLGQEKIELSAL